MSRSMILVVVAAFFLLIGLNITFLRFSTSPALAAAPHDALATPMPQSIGSTDGVTTPTAIPTVPPISVTLQLNSDPPSGVQVRLGQRIAYTLTLINRGAAITNVTVTGFAPDGTALIPGSVNPPTSAQTSLVATTGGLDSLSAASPLEVHAPLTLTWQIATLPVSQTLTFSFAVNVTAPGLPIQSVGRLQINGTAAGATQLVNHGTPLALGETDEPAPPRRTFLPMISRH